MKNKGYTFAFAFFFLREKKMTHAITINNRRQPHTIAAITPPPIPVMTSPILSELRDNDSKISLLGDSIHPFLLHFIHSAGQGTMVYHERKYNKVRYDKDFAVCLY